MYINNSLTEVTSSSNNDYSTTPVTNSRTTASSATTRAVHSVSPQAKATGPSTPLPAGESPAHHITATTTTAALYIDSGPY